MTVKRTFKPIFILFALPLLFFAGCGRSGSSLSGISANTTGTLTGRVTFQQEVAAARFVPRIANAGASNAKVYAYKISTPYQNLVADGNAAHSGADADGNFTIANAPAGDIVLVVDYDGDGKADKREFGLTVSPNSSTTAGNIDIATLNKEPSGSWCEVKTDKNAYRQGEKIVLSFKGFNFGNTAVKCGAKIFMQNAQKQTSVYSDIDVWTSDFSDSNTYATMTAASGIDKTVEKTIPKDWIPATEGGQLVYKVYAIGEAGDIWSAARDTFFLSEDTTLTCDGFSGFSFIGSYGSNGIPQYLDPLRKQFSTSLSAAIAAALPENGNIPFYDPVYFENDTRTTLNLIKDAEVYVTFYSENSKHKNTLGYFSYDSGALPANLSGITLKTVVFPNTTSRDGGLVKGDTVRLGSFKSGKSIAFFLADKGWQGADVRTCMNPADTFFSLSALNPENTSSLKPHAVLLNSRADGLLVFGMEDTIREKKNTVNGVIGNTVYEADPNAQNDFNGLIFVVSASKPDAFKVDDIIDITKCSSDSACDDGDAYTGDNCHFASTLSSYCSHDHVKTLTVEASLSSLTADGFSTTTITVTAKDASGNPVKGAKVDISATSDGLKSPGAVSASSIILYNGTGTVIYQAGIGITTINITITATSGGSTSSKTISLTPYSPPPYD